MEYDMGKLLRDGVLVAKEPESKPTLTTHYEPITAPLEAHHGISKRCPRCNVIKLIEEFKTKNSSSGYCKPCMREYGKELYALKNVTPTGECPICLVVTKLSLDHSHITGNERGRICRKCNVGIGMFNDSIDNFARAIQYLLKNKDT